MGGFGPQLLSANLALDSEFREWRLDGPRLPLYQSRDVCITEHASVNMERGLRECMLTMHIDFSRF